MCTATSVQKNINRANSSNYHFAPREFAHCPPDTGESLDLPVHQNGDGQQKEKLIHLGDGSVRLLRAAGAAFANFVTARFAQRASMKFAFSRSRGLPTWTVPHWIKLERFSQWVAIRIFEVSTRGDELNQILSA